MVEVGGGRAAQPKVSAAIHRMSAGTPTAGCPMPFNPTPESIARGIAQTLPFLLFEYLSFLTLLACLAAYSFVESTAQLVFRGFLGFCLATFLIGSLHCTLVARNDGAKIDSGWVALLFVSGVQLFLGCSSGLLATTSSGRVAT